MGELQSDFYINLTEFYQISLKKKKCLVSQISVQSINGRAMIYIVKTILNFDHKIHCLPSNLQVYHYLPLKTIDNRMEVRTCLHFASGQAFSKVLSLLTCCCCCLRSSQCWSTSCAHRVCIVLSAMTGMNDLTVWLWISLLLKLPCLAVSLSYLTLLPIFIPAYTILLCHYTLQTYSSHTNLTWTTTCTSEHHIL